MTAQSGFEVRKADAPGVCIVDLHGEVDAALVPDMRTRLEGVIGPSCAHVVLDFSQVTYADSSALGLLVWIGRTVEPCGGSVAVVSPTADVSRVLEVSGLLSVAPALSLATSVEQAVTQHAFEASDAPPLWSAEFALHARVEDLAAVRSAVIQRVMSLGFPESVVFDVKVALGEALANAVRHGSRDEEDEVRVVATAFEDRLEIDVVDTGAGFDGVHDVGEDVYAHGGRGVLFMRALMDRVDFIPAPDGGTIVRLVKVRQIRSGS